ncbi:spindle and kinetochore-associated protein 1 isoform X1 [Geospiza fortis]|uniref:SKA complex subunit 1 n=2 Tax=Thraupidae TaxID=400783 RepID=A0A8N5EUK5_GEOFO|nr:spindle and kinetochore-associated protein 1 isoform X1 [Camarhynchus parvulus]XP_030915496.1 spindle and kinetochore-associated protein 1 isoform X1 [Geospiza fortis]
MMKDMASSSLEDLCLHINMKISNIKKCLLLRDIGKDDPRKPVLRKIQNDVILVHDLLNKMENEVKQQEKQKDSLKEMQKAAEREQKEAQHLLEHIPRYLPKPQSCNPAFISASYDIPLPWRGLSNTVPTVKHKGQTKSVEPNTEKKPAKEKKVIKEAALITTEEFASVPAYLKGRITYDQINAVVQEINKAVLGKYKILYQPLKSMSAPVRNLYHRFIEEETKDTKGLFFIVEDDIKEFTHLKLDKRFHSILSILRHCHRLREIRGLGLIRYVIC